MGQLAGKRILTFGDSIIAGHLYEKAGFVEFAAEQEGMKVVRFARNGACILPGRPVDEEGIGGMILTDQIARAAKEGYDPDYVVFNGGTNDAYGPVIDQLGNAQSQSRDTDTFAGAFRATIDAIRKNWPGAKLVYIAVHRLGYRDKTVQQMLHETELSICADMGVRVVNLYDECGLDTSDEVMCWTEPRKQRIDVTEAPYFPKGVFLTGALRLHGDMELYIERDGTLKGSKEPDDYLPRIPSRFEGIERETYSGLLNIGEMDHDAGCTTKKYRDSRRGDDRGRWKDACKARDQAGAGALKRISRISR